MEENNFYYISLIIYKLHYNNNSKSYKKLTNNNCKNYEVIITLFKIIINTQKFCKVNIIFLIEIIKNN